MCAVNRKTSKPLSPISARAVNAVFRILLTGLLFATVVTVSGYFVVRYYAVNKAETLAEKILQASVDEGSNLSEHEEIYAITRYVFDHFKETDPANEPVLRVRPYLTNTRLPEILRYPEGALETLVGKGMCDNAARMLSFVLAQRNYTSSQWNMITPSGAHTALLVETHDETELLVDPFYGIAIPTSPDLAQRNIKNGTPTEDAIQALSENSRTEFYKEFQYASMAKQGDTLVISVALPTISDTLTLGTINGSDKDVKGAGIQNNITPFWHYVGHKYDRAWVRVMNIQQNITLEMILTDKPEEGIITSNPKPTIQGNTLIWHLDEGDTLRFHDKRAKLSLKRLNSYIGVDQIKIYARASTRQKQIKSAF